MRKILIILSIVSIASLSFAAIAYGQSSVEITNVAFTDKPLDNRYVQITFDRDIVRPGNGEGQSAINSALDNVVITALPSTQLEVTEVTAVTGNPRLLRVLFTGDPAASATEARVCFKRIEIKVGEKREEIAKTICATGDILRDFAAERDKQHDLLEEQVPKASSEKNIFASGFVTTARGGSEGGADLSLNSLDLGIPDLTSFLHIKKSTQEGADPKVFEAGARYRTVFLTAVSGELAQAIATARTDENPLSRAAARKKINDLQAQMQSRILAGAIWDFATKLEGAASDFRVTNSVAESTLLLQSMTRPVAGAAGFWRFRLIPVGIEGGHSLGDGELSVARTGMTPGETGQENGEVDWIARLKYGLGLTFYYAPPRAVGPVKRLEADINAVNRHLFLKEAMFNPETMLADRAGKGIRGYVQVDLKLFVAESENGRYGVRLSYNRGSLPPTFARVKSFQFGFVFESNEGEARDQGAN